MLMNNSIHEAVSVLGLFHGCVCDLDSPHATFKAKDLL